MDRKLIDALLIELLQLPEQRRTPEKILANLTLAATAAGLLERPAADEEADCVHVDTQAEWAVLEERLGIVVEALTSDRG